MAGEPFSALVYAANVSLLFTNVNPINNGMRIPKTGRKLCRDVVDHTPRRTHSHPIMKSRNARHHCELATRFV